MARDEAPCDRRHVLGHFRDSATSKIEELVIKAEATQSSRYGMTAAKSRTGYAIRLRTFTKPERGAAPLDQREFW